MDRKTVLQHTGYGFWFWLAGLVFSSLSFISLCQKVLGIGIAPVLGEFLDFYRKAVHPPLDLVFSLARVQPSAWYKDAFMLSFVACAPIARAGFSHIAAGASAIRKAVLAAIVALATLLISASLIGLVQPLGLVVNVAVGVMHPEKKKDFDYVVSVGAARMFVGMIVAAIVFFALNSQL